MGADQSARSNCREGPEDRSSVVQVCQRAFTGYRRRVDRRRVTLVPDGPLLVDGPVEVELPDGTVVPCDRPVVALCTCRRSRRQPFCDTSHRTKVRPKS